MSADAPERLFEAHAKDPAMEAVLQKIVDYLADSDEFRDMAHLPRKGREPDYLYGRWCIRCHNSLPEDWGIKDCDVCGAATGFKGSLSGLLGEWPDESTSIYSGIKRANS